VPGLRWFRDRTAADALARDHGISRATACRYLDEVVIVLAEQAPDLREALERAKDKGFSHPILDAKVIPCDRCKEPCITRSGSRPAGDRITRSGWTWHRVVSDVRRWLCW
jgi:hypothetical protein